MVLGTGATGGAMLPGGAQESCTRGRVLGEAAQGVGRKELSSQISRPTQLASDD